jgi:hypothetical protein
MALVFLSVRPVIIALREAALIKMSAAVTVFSLVTSRAKVSAKILPVDIIANAHLVSQPTERELTVPQLMTVYPIPVLTNLTPTVLMRIWVSLVSVIPVILTKMAETARGLTDVKPILLLTVMLPLFLLVSTWERVLFFSAEKLLALKSAVITPVVTKTAQAISHVIVTTVSSQ